MYVADDEVAHQVSSQSTIWSTSVLDRAAPCVHAEVRLAVGREPLIIELFHLQAIGGERTPAVEGHPRQAPWRTARRARPRAPSRSISSRLAGSAKVPPPMATTVPRSGSRRD